MMLGMLRASKPFLKLMNLLISLLWFWVWGEKAVSIPKAENYRLLNFVCNTYIAKQILPFQLTMTIDELLHQFWNSVYPAVLSSQLPFTSLLTYSILFAVRSLEMEPSPLELRTQHSALHFHPKQEKSLPETFGLRLLARPACRGVSIFLGFDLRGL